MDNKDNTNKYDDIINLPNHRSNKHPRMSLYDRAAQFAPFAALTGHASAIKETARLTDQRIELGEELKSEINRRLKIITDNLKSQPLILITYFKEDNNKSGGKYLEISGSVRQIYTHNSTLVLQDKTVISLNDIYWLDGELFDKLLDDYY